MSNEHIQRISTIAGYHRSRGLGSPLHPLISVVDYRDVQHSPDKNAVSWVYDFYMIAMKKNISGVFRYGQQTYDMIDGTMFFIAPNQVFRIEMDQQQPQDRSGWFLLIHPDLLWGTPLARDINNYEYFGYSTREALFLSEKEEAIVSDIVKNIERECETNMDRFSQQIILSQIEVLLNYSDRFYHRQFLTRKMANHQVLERLEKLLDEYFLHRSSQHGLPTVNYLADELNLSPDYLSSLLRVTTGLSTQQHIHEKLIQKAKEKLSTTNLSVSEIAYELGFEHSQSFSKLFRSKTNSSPLQFRSSFN
ncbi:helix-turn-helix transcriptional regulator [Mucilaginibacter daejeonensis]|uniref:helix-turn-helix domain-containing protein n=1 Tax=Mucilaginibacter daejeonensis TaxID=398049 RepID=UPI001D170FC0|nr:helix-turn-helix transcriptional regulator [Mucilaginibacter daejeonensis]UEG52188.1 helix-turn-helix transcriptional regulator [Mucilaginibacter daejeonensis]